MTEPLPWPTAWGRPSRWRGVGQAAFFGVAAVAAGAGGFDDPWVIAILPLAPPAAGAAPPAVALRYRSVGGVRVGCPTRPRARAALLGSSLRG